MKFDSDSGYFPSRVVDAQGQDLGFVVSGDTLSGEVVIQVHNAEKQPLLSACGYPVRAVAYFDPPLRLVYCGDDPKIKAELEEIHKQELAAYRVRRYTDLTVKLTADPPTEVQSNEPSPAPVPAQ